MSKREDAIREYHRAKIGWEDDFVGPEPQPPVYTVGELISDLSKLDPSLAVWTQPSDGGPSGLAGMAQSVGAYRDRPARLLITSLDEDRWRLRAPR